MKIRWLTSFVILVLFYVTAVTATEPKVKIKQGNLTGKILKYKNKEIYTFLGIPYAKPPQRFQLAEPAVPWEGEWDATKNRSICAQQRLPDLHLVGEEDCLFANIYTTKLPQDIVTELAPVVVYIHGGIFQHSSGDFENYDPTRFLGDEPDPMVFVTFNYRLGVLGFLSTEDSVVPGNMGLKDQIVLLKWVRDNIAAFGGDNQKVTLMGDNAGAISAHMHMLSPLSKGLFQAAISQCGTAITHWALSRDPIGRAQRLAELTDCGDNTTDTKKMVKCLKEVDTYTLIKQSQAVLNWRTDLMVPFLPSVESQEWSNGGAFLPDYPRNMMYDKNFNPVPWLIGVTSHAGLPHSLQLMIFSGIRSDLNNHFDHYAPYYFELDGEMEVAKEASKRILAYYFRGVPIGQTSQTQLAELHTDYYYFLPIVQSTALHLALDNTPPMYLYHFSYQCRKSPLATGVPQGDDTHYIFPSEMYSFIKVDEGTMERKIANRLSKVIRNFVKHRKPITEEDKFNVTWPAIDENEFNFIDFDKTMKLKTSFYKKRMKFWEDIEEILAGEDVSTSDQGSKDEL